LSASSASRSARRATSTTRAPCAASSTAVAAPIPLEAPVTSTTYPSSFPAIRSSSLIGRLLARQRPLGPGRVAVEHHRILHPGPADAGAVRLDRRVLVAERDAEDQPVRLRQAKVVADDPRIKPQRPLRAGGNPARC